jgi:hypothetical protein
MIRCVGPRSRCTTKWLPTVSRGYTKTKDTSGEQENVSLNSNASAPKSVASADGIVAVNDLSDGIGSLEDRQDGRGSSPNPYKRRELPLSPFMNPEIIAAREKHKMPKLPPSKNPTLFQQQLAKNPYARALATPIRQCLVTDTRLPTYFLQDFEVMGHPQTREPWWVPTSLRKGRQDKEGIFSAVQAGSVISDQDSKLGAQKSDAEMDRASTNAPSPITPKTQESTPLSLGPGAYTLSRQALLTAMKSPKSGWHMAPWKDFTTGGTRNSAIARKVRDHASWRTDMDDFVLELMRRRVVEGLVYLVQRKRGYVAGCVDWVDAKWSGRQQGVILWTGKNGCEEGELPGPDPAVDGKAKVALDEDGSPSSYPGHDDPPGFAALTIGKKTPHMVPVHNLQVLLGLGHLEKLKEQCSIFRRELLIVRDKNLTVDLQMKLWKLQGYLAFPEVRNESHAKHKSGRKPVREEAQFHLDTLPFQEPTLGEMKPSSERRRPARDDAEVSRETSRPAEDKEKKRDPAED